MEKNKSFTDTLKEWEEMQTKVIAKIEQGMSWAEAYEEVKKESVFEEK